MGRFLNFFCSKFPLLVSLNVSFPLLVWVNVSRLRVRTPYASLAVAVFDSEYLASVIVRLCTVSNSSYDLSSFSLVNISFAFSLFVLDV